MIEYYKNKSLESLFYVNEFGLVCQEEWKDIPDYEGLYQASDLGRIKSLSRYVKNAWGYYWTKERILSQCDYNSEKVYLGLNLHKQGICTKFMTHILVAMAFLDHVPCGYEIIVDHINTNEKKNNQLSNLQIITQRENASKDKKGSSKFIGIYFDKKYKKWVSRIRIEKLRFTLGRFQNEKDASDVYQLALKNWEEFKIYPTKKEKNCSSKYTGISYRKDSKKWASRITINSKRIFLGVFITEEEAYDAYKKALLEKNKPSD